MASDSIPPLRDRLPMILAAVGRLGVATVAEVAEDLDLSKALTRNGLIDLERRGDVTLIDDRPMTWEVSESSGGWISREDAWLAAHVLRVGIKDGRLGDPSAQVLARLERLIDVIDRSPKE